MNLERLKLLIFVVHLDLQFSQPNFKAYKQLQLLLLGVLTALASDDFADEIEFLKLLAMMVIVSSRYYEKSIFQQQSNDLDPKSPQIPKLHLLSACFLAHPLFGLLHGPCLCVQGLHCTTSHDCLGRQKNKICPQ